MKNGISKREKEGPSSTLSSASSDAGFQDYMTDTLNKGMLAIMLSIGHRTKLFDIISSLSNPSTSEEISLQAKLNERYVREWLGAMVVSRVIEYDPVHKTYWLDKEKMNSLIRASGSYNFAASMQWIPLLAQVEDDIVNCFQKGGGVYYDTFKRFHEVMAEESAQTVVAGLFDFILPLIQGLEENLMKGISVLDIGCGSGHAINAMAARFPNSKFVGYDISEEAINMARSEGQQLGNKNVSFDVNDVSNPHVMKTGFDLVVAFDAIHDQRDPANVLKNIASIINPEGGIFLMQDILGSSSLEKNINHPLGPFLYTISCMHCMSVSLAQNGAGLGAMWGRERAIEMLKGAGFSSVEVKTLEHDFQNYYYIAKIAPKDMSL
jgi:2-polyprenyl-3-methyl-5-hydroxy-6-metoxy-1,4-benzoquinol methylase